MKKKILIVGQTPPPYHGQAIMIKNLVEYDFSELEIYHIRMRFSDETNIGKFSFLKILLLPRIILSIFWYRIRYNVRNLYYPPAGPDFIPIIRDIIILGATRFLFSKTIFHFHAGGISEKIAESNSVLKFLAKRWVYAKPNLTIRLSRRNPEDGLFFKAKKDIVIPYGLKDFFNEKYNVTNNEVPVILYVGSVKKSKGVLDLINAAKILMEKKLSFHLKIMGKFDCLSFEEEITVILKENKSLQKHVSLVGIKTGEDKWKEYGSSDIFCFPSYYECETFGTVLVEAMQYSLPIVSTFWRGIPDIVEDGVSGFLLDINNVSEIANKLEVLIKNNELRIDMGNKGREIFINKFQEISYYKKFGNEVSNVCS
ncbi:glycosyltransferase [Maribacter polysaccharolyticus]|uniref:glycosyltransferase n=1 Tax=Maribacter polysaccharolyticus TaxID=3020831 RepID=UPI00237F6E95|nr:glycosyltransferase [Maribacter polysaccharolyticus]MDE3742223.1 glycosyltransferase [Maribacter polysaccharolyticus]